MEHIVTGLEYVAYCAFYTMHQASVGTVPPPGVYLVTYSSHHIINFISHIQMGELYNVREFD